MKILKIILIVIAAIVALVLIVAAFLPSQNTLERSIEINQPAEVVYKEVADFNNWKAWNPWTEMDSTAKVGVSGAPLQTGQVWDWEGKETGSGAMTLDSLTENTYLKTKLEFKTPMKGEALCFWEFEPTSKGTQVTWSYSGKADYPMGRIFGLCMDKFLGPQFEKGLQNLKAVSENK